MTKSFQAFLALMLSACAANPYDRFYISEPGARPVVGASVEPEALPSSNLREDVAKYVSRGYAVIGSASFNGPRYTEEQMLEKASSVGASVVLYDEQLSETVSGAFVMPTTTTATAYPSGPGGPIAIYGYTTGGNVIPYSVDRYSETAVFLAAP